MPNKEDYQKRKEYYKEQSKQYRLNNKEKYKQYYLNNKEKLSGYYIQYNLDNKEQIKEKMKEWKQSPEGKKSIRISAWKTRGIIDEDLGAVYDYYFKQTNCMICLKQFKSTKDRHLDHDHDTGEIRYICCNNCNCHLLREKYNI